METTTFYHELTLQLPAIHPSMSKIGTFGPIVIKVNDFGKDNHLLPFIGGWIAKYAKVWYSNHDSEEIFKNMKVVMPVTEAEEEALYRTIISVSPFGNSLTETILQDNERKIFPLVQPLVVKEHSAKALIDAMEAFIVNEASCRIAAVVIHERDGKSYLKDDFDGLRKAIHEFGIPLVMGYRSVDDITLEDVSYLSRFNAAAIVGNRENKSTFSSITLKPFGRYHSSKLQVTFAYRHDGELIRKTAKELANRNKVDHVDAITSPLQTVLDVYKALRVF